MLNPRSARRSSSNIRTYILAVTVIASLVIPMVLVGESERTKAKAKRPAETPPNNAPPQSFSIGESSTSTAADEIVASASKHISEVLFPPELPEGFRSAEVPSLTDRLSAKIAELAPAKSNKDDTDEGTESPLPPAPPQPAASVDYEFGTDGKADATRWDGDTKQFQIRNSNDGSTTTYTFSSASSGAKPAPADYDDDGKTDAAVFDSGTWYIRTSSNGTTSTISFGQSGDIPVSGDYRNADGADELAYYRPSNGTWYWREFGNATAYTYGFGNSTDIPTPGDYDGDGDIDPAIYRASSGDWWISGIGVYNWGLAEDIPVAADYDGDGKTDRAVFRPSTGTWWIYRSSTPSYFAINWGNWADQPVIGDFNGDNQADAAVWRPSSGVWYIKHTDDTTHEYHSLGLAGDFAANSAYVKQVGGSVSSDALSLARLAPRNATGGTNLYSQNFGWGTSLVSLPGRSGLDLNIGLSYNSLVWTKQGSSIYFDADYSNVTPGFNLGYPTIEESFYDSVTGKWNYLMITPSGGRVQFRQTSVSSAYEATDSSYLLLSMDPADAPNDPPDDIDFEVRDTSGTTMSYEWIAGAFRCTKVKDPNGNYLTLAYNAFGYLATATDTLGRVVTVNYDSQYYPTSVTQTWKADNGTGSNTTHTWATFTYTTLEIQTSFTGVTVVGPPNGTYIKVLEKVTYPDTSWTKFLYNGYGQVKQVENYADDDHLLNYTRTNLDSVSGSQSDCPRFTLTAMKAENFNLSGGAGTEVEVKVHNSAPSSGSYSLQGGSLTGSASVVDTYLENHPDNLRTKTYFGSSGWREGLVLATEDCLSTSSTCTTQKRWTWTQWEQDQVGLSEHPYQRNPRVIETRVGDGTNTKRTTIAFLEPESPPMNTDISLYGLPNLIQVYASDLSTVIKKSEITYKLTSTYTDRRILGLPLETKSWGWNDIDNELEYISRTTFDYDYDDDFAVSGMGQSVTPVQHDSTNFGATFSAGRGNLTKTVRWDVSDDDNTSLAVETRTLYNTAGSVVATITPWDGTNTRTVKVGYTDTWNSTGNPTTYAYPTTITDPANNSSTVKYRYDIGGNVEATSPAPAGQTYGKTTKRVFDSLGRLQKNSVYVNTTEQAYTRYEYPSSGVHSKVFSTLVDTNSNGPDSNDEVLSESWHDGAGRVLRSRVPHTFSSGTPATWAGSLTEYDLLGRVTRQSVPTEVDNSFAATGDDATRGFIWNYQQYDWMGRTTRTIPSDSTGSDGKDTLISYEGCGCAGGLVTTVQGPLVPRTDTTSDARRKQKSFADILGRTWKTQTFKWDGSTVYLTTETSFNGRDQAVSVEQTDENSVVQTTTATFDGHGRIATQKNPNDESGTNTSWTYNGDDSIATVTDPRGAVTTYSYGNPTIAEKRPLLLGISYAPPSTQPSYTTIADTPDVEFEYDALGNRTYMEDGSGTTTYVYDSLSRLTSETKTFTGVTGNFPLTYTYQISGKLKSITDPFGDVINYNDDKAARTTSVTGSTYAGITTYASGIEFRAFGGVKEMTYGTSSSSTVAYEYDNALRPVEYDATVGSGYIRRATYEYFNDGAVKNVSNLLDSGLDQNYKFDQVGRLVSSVSGQKLNNEDEMEEPFSQNIGYNAFDDMTGRTNEIWGAEASFSASYTNGRKTGGNEVYDKEGSLVDKTTAPNKYDRWRFDAAGRNHEIIKRWYQSVPSPTRDSTQTIEKTSDGDGLEVKRVDTDDWFSTFPTSTSGTITSSEYYVRSTLLGGKVVTKLDSDAEKKVTLVYAGGSVLAEQRVLWESPGVYWRHEDRLTGSYSKINASGNYGGHADDSPTNVEYEPLGGSVSPHDTTPEPGIVPPHSSILQFKFAGDVTRPEYGCVVDGMMQAGLGVCTEMLSRGIATPRRDFYQPLLLGHWIDEEDPDTPVNPNGQSGNIDAPGVITRFVAFVNVLIKQMACDKRLGSILADEGALATTAYEPGSLRKNGKPRTRIGMRGEDPRKGVMHLFPNRTGTAVSGEPGFVGNLYVPTGYSSLIGKADDYYVEDEKGVKVLDTTYSNIQVTYRAGSLNKFGWTRGLQISFVHAGPVNHSSRLPTPIRNGPIRQNNTQLIGTIGADGSPYDGGGGGGRKWLQYEWGDRNQAVDTDMTPGDYIHNHVMFYTFKGGKRVGVDPRSVFCSDLGF